MTYFLAYKPLWIFASLSILSFLSLALISCVGWGKRIATQTSPHKLDFTFHKQSLKSMKKHANLLILLAAIGLILNYVFLILIYATNLTFLDHVEPSVAAVSWLFHKGYSLYHPLDSAERYSSSYGPVLYLINGFFLQGFGATIPSAKLAGVFSAILTLIFIFLALKTQLTYSKSILILAYTAITFIALGSGAESFWTRADPIILMGVSLGLLAVVRTNVLVATLLTALVVGVSVNIKIHSILYFLPVLWLLYSRYGRYFLAGALIGSLPIAIGPFLSPQVSVYNYISWLREASQHGFLLRKLIDNIEWLIYLILPIILLLLYCLVADKKNLAKFWKHNQGYIYSLVVSSTAVVIIASKAGAGRHHLLPFIPLFVYLLALSISQVKQIPMTGLKIKSIAYKGLISLVFALIASTLLSAFIKETTILNSLNRYSGADIVSDITEISTSYKGVNIGMGYGGKYINDAVREWSDYELTFYRPVLVFAGNPYLLDTVTLMDTQKAGMNIPQPTLDALKSCQTKIWLIPQGGQAFQLSNFYPPNEQVFSDEFKSTFLNNYALQGQSKYFDLWFCQER